MKVLLVHDVERQTPQGIIRWAYANRTAALQKYAPDGWAVDRISIYQLQDMRQRREVMPEYDVVFNLDYQSATVVRACVPMGTPIVSSFNKDSSANTEYWDPCYTASSFVLCNNLDRFLWAISKGYDRVCYITNGVDVDFWNSDRVMADREIDVAWSGSASPKKGKRFSSVILPLRDMLQCNHSFRPILNAESKDIYTIGQQREWYSRSKIYLCASKTEGGGPSSLMEAMACGCAPVTTAIGSVPEFGVNDFNCIVTGPYAGQFKSQIDFLLENEGKLAKMGKNAQNTIRDKYAYGTSHGPDRWFYALFEKIANGETVRPFDYKSVGWDEI